MNNCCDVCGDCDHLEEGYCVIRNHVVGYTESACFNFERRDD